MSKNEIRPFPYSRKDIERTKESLLTDFSRRVPGEPTEEFIERMLKGQGGILKLEEAIREEQGN